MAVVNKKIEERITPLIGCTLTTMYSVDLPELLQTKLTLSQMIAIMTTITNEMNTRIQNNPATHRMASPITSPSSSTHSTPSSSPFLPSSASEFAIPSLRLKQNAKENESADVDHLIVMLNDPDSEMGNRMRREFFSVFGTPLLGACRGVAGGRGKHYDFEIETVQGWLKVEHKGSIKEKPISADSNPWEQGVQFHNGGANKYSIAKKYAEGWYTKYIGSGLLKERYGLTSPLPTMEEWIQRDVRTQGDPKTAFGQELKRVYRETHPKGSLEKERDEFVEEFIHQCTPEDNRIFAAEVLPVIQSAFADKDVWLQIAGNVHSDSFYFRWSPSLQIDRIESVKIHKKSDIQMKIDCGKGLILHPILRWGKGQGFSNLRIDLK